MSPRTISIPEDRVIRAGECYPLQTFKECTGQGTAALRRARQQGLVIRRVGLRSFILGQDWLDFVAKHGKRVK